MENRKRTIQIKFRVNEVEKKIIDDRIIKVGIGRERYLRRISMNGMIYTQDTRPIYKLAFEVNKIGKNINQIIKHIHKSKEVSMNDMRNLEERLDKIWQLLK